MLRSFSFPGCAPLRTETLQYIFNLCIPDPVEVQAGGGRGVKKGLLLGVADVPEAADISHLLELLFGSSHKPHSKPQDGVSIGLEVDQHGLIADNFVQKVDMNRQEVGTGPIRMPHAVDKASNSGKQQPSTQLAIPLRFVSRKARTALQVPVALDQVTIQRSNTLPGYRLQRKHVFGISTTRYSGNALYVLPAPTASRRPGPKAPSAFIDNATLLYTSAALGVVHSLNDNQQVFFDQHTDDITCLALSSDCQYAATGCMGKKSLVYIWSTAPPSLAEASPALACIGQGCFARGVCAIDFTYDSKYIVAIGCDDNHLLGKKSWRVMQWDGVLRAASAHT